MLDALKKWWKERGDNADEAEGKHALEEHDETVDRGPGGWSPLGDLSKLSDDQ